MLSRPFLVVICLLCCPTGCATWNNPETSFQLPVLQMRSDTVVCEIAFVQWDTHESDTNQRFWQTIDEQFLPVEVRRRLSENGLRLGLISGQLPDQVRRKLGATVDPIAALTAETLAPGTEMLSRRETKQCRDGITEIIEVLPHRPNTAVILFNEEGRVRAEQFHQPRGFFALTTFAEGDGRIRLELTPGIEHGDWRKRVTVMQGGMRYDQRRDQRLFDSLKATAQLAPDHILVVTSTPEAKGLGATFFANRFVSGTEQLFLLIRLSRRQDDDLFAPSAKLAPIVTPQE